DGSHHSPFSGLTHLFSPAALAPGTNRAAGTLSPGGRSRSAPVGFSWLSVVSPGVYPRALTTRLRLLCARRYWSVAQNLVLRRAFYLVVGDSEFAEDRVGLLGEVWRPPVQPRGGLS